ncbi:MAG TPA: hypothetical protein VJU84_14235 [Pyrinomonadaceae bacterium]|nr:hypothetical protein [Pyrinomonadaceae bacterium]
MKIPPTAVGGYSDPALDIASSKQDLNNPPTTVGGISSISISLACSLDLNHPPTAVGGIHKFRVFRVIRGLFYGLSLSIKASGRYSAGLLRNHGRLDHQLGGCVIGRR